MGEGWLSLLKCFPPLNLSKVRLFKGSDVILSDYSLPRQHLHQGVLPGLRLCNSYTGGSDVVPSDYSLPRQHLHQGVPPGLHLCNSYTKGCPHHLVSVCSVAHGTLYLRWLIIVLPHILSLCQHFICQHHLLSTVIGKILWRISCGIVI
jgi:hypothetical protein